MNRLTYLPLAVFTTACPFVCAQTPGAKEAAPPAAKEAAPAAEPSRAAVEKYVTELKAVIVSREASATRLVNEIAAQDHSIMTAVDEVLQILTT